MKHLIITVLLLGATTIMQAQSVDFYGKQVAKDICSQYGMKDDVEAKASLDKICDAADIPNNFVLAPCTNIDNCFALYKNGYSYIVYDIQFFNKVKTFGFTSKNLPKNNIDWAALTILAHEIGHHMCLHTTNPNLASIYTPVQIELQADEYAGTIMYRLGATLAQAQEAMRSNDVPEEATLTHPARKDRLEAIAKGWNKEYKKNADRNNSTTIIPNSGKPDNGNAAPAVTDNTNGGAGNQGNNQPTVATPIRPAIIVIPYTKQGEDIRTILESDPAIGIAVTKIKEGFDAKNYNTIDFVAKLKQIEDQKTFHGQNQSDIKQQLIQNSGAQIYVEVQLNKITSNGLNKATVLLQAYDVSSGLSLANGDCTSNANRSTDFQALAAGAIAIEHGDETIPCGEAFLNTLQASMERMSREGMPLALQVGFSPQSKYNAHSIIKEDEFGDVLNDWLQKNTLNVNQGGVTKLMINYNEIRIPYRDPVTGKTTLVPTFANKIVSFLRKTYAISAESDVKQGIIYITVN